MATASEQTLLAKCGICLDNLRHSCRLPCNHSFCKECVESWISDNDTNSLICPDCKRVTHIPSGDITTLVQTNMAEKVQIDYTQMMCSKCTRRDVRATVYCQNCTAYLCATCFDSHQTWPDLKHHVTVAIEDLSSGKVHITKMEDHMCTKHEGECKKFYCVTCQQLVCRDCIVMKQHCRDHDYVTLKEAAEEKLNAVKQAMKEFDKKKKECQDVNIETASSLTQLAENADKAKKSLQQAKMDYLEQIEHVYSKMDGIVDLLKNIDDTRLKTSWKSVNDILKEIEKASTEGQALVESDSHYHIVENSESILDTLQQVKQMTLNKVDHMVKFPTSVSIGEFKQPWKHRGGFKVDCSYYPSGIDVTSDGKVAVCDCNIRVKVFSQSGNLLHTSKNGKLGGYGDICITNDDTYLYPLKSHSVVKTKSDFAVISNFKTVNVNTNPSEVVAVTVDRNGFMIFGMKDKAISIHNRDGSLKCSYAIPYEPDSVAVTSNAEVVAVSEKDGSVQLFDYSGNCLHTLDRPDDVTKWKPRYVCCSTTDEIFVVNRGSPKAIYKYIAGRICIGCVTREVEKPRCIALSHDDQILYVTEREKKMVKKFQRP